MNETERVRKQMSQIIYKGHDGDGYYNSSKIADQILAIADICVKADDQEVPDIENYCQASQECTQFEYEGRMRGYRQAQQDMLTADWVKVVKK